MGSQRVRRDWSDLARTAHTERLPFPLFPSLYSSPFILSPGCPEVSVKAGDVAGTTVLFEVYVLVTQSRLTLCNPMDCRPPGSSVHGILGTNTGVSYHSLLQGLFSTRGSNPGLPPGRQILNHLSHEGSCSIRLKIVSLLFVFVFCVLLCEKCYKAITYSTT